LFHTGRNSEYDGSKYLTERSFQKEDQLKMERDEYDEESDDYENLNFRDSRFNIN